MLNKRESTMKNILIIVAGVAVLIVVVILFSSRGTDTDSSPSQKTRGFTFETLAELEFVDYEGNVVSLGDFAGKRLIVNAWAAWCPFCVQELPDFAEVQERFGDEVVFISIDRAESLATAKRFSDNLGVTDKLVFWLDKSDNFYRAIGGFSMPETIFIDVDGTVVQHKRGPMKVPEITQRINESFGL